MQKIEVTFDESQLTLDKGAQAVKDAITAIRNALRAGTAERIILLQDQIKKHGGTLPPAEAKSKK